MSVRSATRYLITGANGQLGGTFAKALRNMLGKDGVILSDIKKSPSIHNEPCVFERIDVRNPTEVAKIVEKYEITGIVHLAAMLSATAEKKLREGFELNVNPLSDLFLLAKEKKLQIFIPSTIAAFGSDSPLDPTPNICIQRPLSLYGVSKVYMERLGEYFSKVHGVDFRCLRYPGIISATQPGGGTTDYANDVFFRGILQGDYECYLKPTTRLPFAFIDDCVENTLKFLMAPESKLKERVYNYGAFSTTPQELFDVIQKKCFPDIKISYKIDPVRQRIADSWPKRLDVSAAINDWDLKNSHNLESTVVKVHSEFVKILKEIERNNKI